MNILLVEDDEICLLGMTSILKDHGRVYEFTQGTLAQTSLFRQAYDIAFIDLDLEEELLGLSLVHECVSRGIYTVVVSGREDDKAIVNSYDLGAKDFIAKPADRETISNVYHRFLYDTKLRRENEFLNAPHLPSTLIEDLRYYSFSKKPLLITGETGSGKTTLAKNIHGILSSLYDKKLPFVFLNCAEFNEQTIESQLFGHMRGAFTGAESDHKGCFEQAEGGILFLDEIASLPYDTQAKFLRVLEEKRVRPLGSEFEREIDFILISATCEDLKEKVELGDFRKDLYMRLNGLSIELSSFKNYSRDEKVRMINTLLKNNKRRVVLSNSALDYIADYEWQGNLRELNSFISRVCETLNGYVKIDDIQKLLRSDSSTYDFSSLSSRVKEVGLAQLLSEIESFMINHFYELNNCHARKTIKDLKISNNNFYKYIKREE